jgi:hypothetical protein
MCGLFGFAVFFPHYLTGGMNFGGKKFVEHNVFCLFSLQILSETFRILTRTELDTITNVNRFSGTVPGILVTF